MINQEKKYNLIKFEDGDFSLDEKVTHEKKLIALTYERIYAIIILKIGDSI